MALDHILGAVGGAVALSLKGFLRWFLVIEFRPSCVQGNRAPHSLLDGPAIAPRRGSASLVLLQRKLRQPL
jgi:hypothetical protein